MSPIRTKPFPGGAFIDENERAAVLEVLDSKILSGFVAAAGDHFLGGAKVKELEKLFCDYFEVHHAMAVNSATAGLHAAVAACGIGPSDEVIVTPYTMCASATSILMQSGIPIFADIDPVTLGLDAESVRKKITKKTKAIMVVHLFGQSAPMDEIMAIAKEHNLKVIEDCAQSPGTVYKGQYVGTIGDVGIFSFNQHKTITTGEGGIVITNNEDIARTIQLVRNHGEAVVEAMAIEDVTNTMGWNYRMTELEAAVGVEQFKKLDFLNSHRIELAKYLSSKLEQFEELELPKIENDSNHVYFILPIKYRPKEKGLSRLALVQALNAEGIPFGAGYVKPIYLMPYFQSKKGFGDKGWPFTSSENELNYGKGICPVVEQMHEDILIHTNVCQYPATKEDMDDVVLAFEKIFLSASKSL